MATKLTSRDVEKKYDAWCDINTRNWDRGKSCEAFQAGEQWDAQVVERRARESKESLILNISGTKVATVKANFKEIQLTLDLTPNTNNTDPEAEDQQEVYKAIMEHIAINNESRDAFDHCADKMLEYGSAVAKVGYAYENQKSLNKGITISSIDNVSECFFDPMAKLPSRVDGAYCGIVKSNLDKNNLPVAYQAKAQKNNTLIDYWYRSFKKQKFALLVSGEYKRIDLIDESVDEVAENELGQPIIKVRNVASIQYCRFLNEDKVESQQWPTDDLLPLVYWYGATKTIDKRLFTTPYIYPLMDPQRLLNYAISTQASALKSASSGKSIILSKEHVLNTDAQESAKKYSSSSGAFVFDQASTPPQPLPQFQMPQGLDAISGNVAQLIDSISGVQLSQMGSKDNAISGVAIDARVRQSEVINNNLMDAHVNCINTVAQIVQQMIPKVYTEQRAMVVKNIGGQAQILSINVPQPVTGTLQNNVKLMANKYLYSISAGPSSALQKQNAIADLQALGQANPQLAPFVGIATLESMNLPDKDGLIQVMKSQLGPLQLQLFEGQISLDEFMQQQAMQQQQQAQQQAQQQPQTIPVPFKMNMQEREMQVKEQNNQISMQKLNIEAQKAGIQQQEANLKETMAPQELDLKRNEVGAENLKTMSEERQNQRDNISKVTVAHIQNNVDPEEEDIL